MRKSIYIETTIPVYYFEKRLELRYQQQMTRDWWDTQRHNFLLYISEMTLFELEADDYPDKIEILGLINDISILQINDTLREIVEVYRKNYLMPIHHTGDAFHLAVASYYKIDYILTWNCQHLANINKEEHIKIINERLGLTTPRIITPLQIFQEDTNDI